MPSINDDEYERAVAFLQEFHSRRVATLISPSSLDSTLDAISEDDDLAEDFALALTVSRRGPLMNLCNSTVEHPMKRSPKMKKTATIRCLVELDDSSASDDSDASSNVSETSRSSSVAYHRSTCRPMKKYEVDTDDNNVYCIGGGGNQMSKRRCGRVGTR